VNENKNNQIQQDLEQYQMPDSLKQQDEATYNVGYETTTGNKTAPNHDISKKK